MAAPLTTNAVLKITSLADDLIVGAAGKVSPAQVRLRGSEYKWTLGKVDPPTVYTLHAGEFTLTEVISDIVSASNGDGQDVEWYFEEDEANKAYTIAINANRTIGWTVFESDPGPDPRIVIEVIEDPPAAHQLFKIEKLD